MYIDQIVYHHSPNSTKWVTGITGLRKIAEIIMKSKEKHKKITKKKKSQKWRESYESWKS